MFGTWGKLSSRTPTIKWYLQSISLLRALPFPHHSFHECHVCVLNFVAFINWRDCSFLESSVDSKIAPLWHEWKWDFYSVSAGFRLHSWLAVDLPDIYHITPQYYWTLDSDWWIFCDRTAVDQFHIYALVLIRYCFCSKDVRWDLLMRRSSRWRDLYSAFGDGVSCQRFATSWSFPMQERLQGVMKSCKLNVKLFKIKGLVVSQWNYNLLVV